MASEAKNSSSLLNPWILNFEKLGLELKCPMCMNLLTKPVVLPCNHMFCKLCLPKSRRYRVGYNECAACNSTFTDQEPAHASFLENILEIYRSLSATFHSTVLPLISAASADLLEEKIAKKVLKDETKQLQDNGKGEVLEELDVNQAPEEFPLGGSPSFDASKDAGQNSEPGSTNGIAEKCSIKRSGGCHAGGVDQEKLHNTFHTREPKRQKKLCYSPSLGVAQRHGERQSIIPHPDRSVLSNCDIRTLKDDVRVSSLPSNSDASDVNGSICSFCHSSKITDGTGKMLHYADGKAVARDEANFFSAIPVHSKCIDWAPKVYYVGETIKNLELELTRASKLKCNVCGLKGAALGCFAKSCRRSYHVPCSLTIPGCRWDCNDFLMLCPTHKSFKFPSEKSQPRKIDSGETQSRPTQGTTEKLSFWATSECGPQEWVFCGSALSPEEKRIVNAFAVLCGAKVVKSWNPTVTHVIAATDSNGACSRTLKVLMAILDGTWILTMDWVKACVTEKRPVMEDVYEIKMDNHGCRDGPKTGRLRASNNAVKLFDGLSFYFSGDFITAYKSDLSDLVIVGGGTILENMEQTVPQGQNPQPKTMNLVVYNRDIALREKEATCSISNRLSEAEEIAMRNDALVIPHTWILESIAACKVLPYPSLIM